MFMEQITLVFLIGAFILFLMQVKFKNETSVKVMGLLTSVSSVALSLIDPELVANGNLMAVMVACGFGLTLYNVIGLYKVV